MTPIAIPQHHFINLAQMQRWRRLVTKYTDSELVRNGKDFDFMNAARAFIAIDVLLISGVAKAAAFESIFTTFKKTL
jgi:hypothetical protein